MVHVAAFLTFQTQGLLLGGLGESVLQRIFLSAVADFFACVGPFACCEGSAFTCLVEADCMRRVRFAFWTVSVDFFGNVHVIHYQLPNKETILLIYFMTYKPKKQLARYFNQSKNV